MLTGRIKMAQWEDAYHWSPTKECEKENKADFCVNSDGILCYQDRICVSTDETITTRY